MITYILGFVNITNIYLLSKNEEKKLSYKRVNRMDEKFVRDRITQLRLQKGVSEYTMSYDLGHSRGYIYNFSSGKALPPLKELFAICDYFGITVSQFFDETVAAPKLADEILPDIQSLDEQDLLLVKEIIERLKRK